MVLFVLGSKGIDFPLVRLYVCVGVYVCVCESVCVCVCVCGEGTWFPLPHATTPLMSVWLLSAAHFPMFTYPSYQTSK